tara:strand:- start:843 stop:1133 length:291 start_codon:yes stop_codon:yes gene_type:complete
MLGLKELLLFIFFLISLNSERVESFNLFEISLMGIGAGLILDQRFDNSVEYSNNYALQEEVLDKFHESKKRKLSPSYFRELPIQQKLRLIEEIEKF